MTQFNRMPYPLTSCLVPQKQQPSPTLLMQSCAQSFHSQTCGVVEAQRAQWRCMQRSEPATSSATQQLQQRTSRQDTQQQLNQEEISQPSLFSPCHYTSSVPTSSPGSATLPACAPWLAAATLHTASAATTNCELTGCSSSAQRQLCLSPVDRSTKVGASE